MSFGKDFFFEGGMSEPVEGGAALAWRLLATLEGGSLLVATSALLVYTVRNMIFHHNRNRRTVKHVLVTNTTNTLGRELKKRLETHGCLVDTISNDVCIEAAARVDAMVVVGAEPKAYTLDGIADLVNEDVYDNLKLLESLSSRVHDGGYIAWACACNEDPAPNTFSEAGAAFDTVIRASLLHTAKIRGCEAIWVGRCTSSEQAAERTVTALLASTTHRTARFSFRSTAHPVREHFG